MNKKVTIVGAGFSGLTVAEALLNKGFQVEIHDKQARAGGLLDTEASPAGMIETAANAILASEKVEDLFHRLGVVPAERRSSARKRFIYWEKPKRWPLSMAATWSLIKRAILVRSEKSLEPREGESLAKWANRFAGKEFGERLLYPGLQGVFAGDPERLSATLIYNQLFKDKPAKGHWKGSVAPENGMGQLIEALRKRIKQKGAEIHLKSNFALTNSSETTILATSAWQASEIIKSYDLQASKILATCESLPLISLTAFFAPHPKHFEGFGCLFPESQGFNALGVLFNHAIFQGRSDVRSETWIFGGPKDQGMTAYSDEHLMEKLYLDRKHLYGDTESALSFKITRWQRAIPHYTVAWESALRTLNVEPPVYLHGNYLGVIGLTRILERSHQLADQIARAHG